MASALGVAGAPLHAKREIPNYRVVGAPAPAAQPGMPGRYPGQVVDVHHPRSVDEATEALDPAAVKEMMARGMTALTGAASVSGAWRTFFEKGDVVGIKVNCVGRPHVVSSPEVVKEIVANLMALGIPPESIYLYERFQSQMDEVNYPAHLPAGVRLIGAEGRRGGSREYDPAMYVDVDFFGEEDTRSSVMRVVSRTVTKIINVPNMKDHGASGVTGCLKNIAYGSYSNVARSHMRGVSHTYSFIGTLAAAEPVRSKTVLQVMDGLKGVWHGGPFSRERKYRFYPKRMMFGTDPVAIDRLVLDIVDDERKRRGAVSVWDRSTRIGTGKERDEDPNVNVLVREPGHIEFAGSLGLGVADLDKIRIRRIDL
ncbi:MAG: DUF362 domain-containing protein [Bryobacterales bacterium]|nr:DUF362 domain-containing protein [Bryobacterales bacterium]